jgi:dihydrofolate reductase
VNSGLARPTVCVYIAVSLDGYIARADGRIDWLDAMQRPGEDYGYTEFFAAIDAIVLGRVTYDQVLTFGDWPFAGRQVVVLTHRPLASKHDERGHDGALGPLLRSLAAAGARRVYLDGGEAIRQGLSGDLVDEMTLSAVPCLRGEGRRLFQRGLPESGWSLRGSHSFTSGLVQSVYRRKRDTA